jgi:hypothetical protein
MLKRHIRDANFQFGPPDGWDETDPDCATLPVRVEVAGRHRVYCSAWEPTPDELAALNAGGSVVLRCAGSQPPVSLAVEPQDSPLPHAKAQAAIKGGRRSAN